MEFPGWILPSAKTPLNSVVLFHFWWIVTILRYLEPMCSSWVRTAGKFQKKLFNLSWLMTASNCSIGTKAVENRFLWFILVHGLWKLLCSEPRDEEFCCNLGGQLLGLNLLSFLVLGMNCESWVVTAFVPWGRSCRAVSLQKSLDAAGFGFLGFSLGLSCVLLTGLVIYEGLQWVFGSESALWSCSSPFPLCFIPIIHLPVAVEFGLINKTSLIDRWQRLQPGNKEWDSKAGGSEDTPSVWGAVIPFELEFHSLNRVRI